MPEIERIADEPDRHGERMGEEQPVHASLRPSRDKQKRPGDRQQSQPTRKCARLVASGYARRDERQTERGLKLGVPAEQLVTIHVEIGEDPQAISSQKRANGR